MTKKITAAAFTTLVLAATALQAQETAPEAEAPKTQDQMQTGEMAGKMGMEGMEGMMPMRQMMAQMGPMMEACTEMMQTMNGHMKYAEPQADNG